MAALRSNLNRYRSYGQYPGAGDSTNSEREPAVSWNSGGPPAAPAVHAPNGMQEPQARSSTTSSRLEYIINAMAYIRGELDGLKESDRVLLEIFKQLECNVSELTDSISTWKSGGNPASPGRPLSFTDLDMGASRSSYCENPPFRFNGLETILDSSKEDISYKESDSLSLAEQEEQESSSISCSPVLAPPLHRSRTSINSSGGGSGSSGARRPGNPSPPPLLKTSTSYNSRLASSASIARLQDETGSNISRNSSIDSGIQFASEAENGSTNGGVEPMQVHHTTTSSTTTAEAPEESSNDMRKSVGFADDIFAALGMK